MPQAFIPTRNWAWLLAPLWFAATLHAEEAPTLPDSVYIMAPIEVEGDPVEAFAERSERSLARSVIRPDENPHRLPAARILLREMPGVELRRYGGLGSFSTASIRGSGGSELAVYLDGVDLRHPMSGSLNLDELPLTGVERIEVYRGAVPSELGGGSPAGAIHMVSENKRARRFSLSAGSYGTTRVSAGGAGAGPCGMRAQVSVSLLASRSDFFYLDRQGTQANADDDTLRLRRNADMRAGDFLMRLKRPSAVGEFSLMYRWLLRDNGLPGSEALPTYHTRSVKRGQDLRINWRLPLIGHALRLESTAWGRDGVTEFQNPEKESGPFLVGDETRDHLRSLGLQMRADLFAPPWHFLLRGEHRDDRFQPDNLNPAKFEDYERRRRGLHWAGELRREGRKLLLVAAYGEERLRDNYFGPPSLPWLPPVEKAEHDTFAAFRRTGFRWRLKEDENSGLDLFGNLNEGYRAPSLLELFGQDVSVQANPELLPERGRGGDLGLTLRGIRGDLQARLEISFFQRRMWDQILFMRNSQYSVKAQNLESSEIRGSELSLLLDWRSWTLSLADTRLDARDKSGHPDYDGKALPYRTPHRFFARLMNEFGRFALFGELEKRDAVFTDRYNDPDRRLAATRFLGAGLSTSISKNWSLSLEGMNLEDTRAEDVLGFPLPGRTWLMTLEWNGYKGTTL
ncbi:TonB-dependent receptor [bacterium]|nr:TonB-dependent receptor [bacterium]